MTVNSQETILDVSDLRTYFFLGKGGILKAVDGLDLAAGRGQTLGIVGESGCGKSVTAFSILRLLKTPARIVHGNVIFDGIDLLKLSNRQMREIRGSHISMIFQDPMTSLNPLFKIGDQIIEAIERHKQLTRRQAYSKVVELLELVGIADAAKRFSAYPHQLSGGMRQRVMIAMAISCKPKLIIADEPTTALDVTIQAQILNLMRELKDSIGTTIILITHNFGVVAENTDSVVVMYCGKAVEKAKTIDLFNKPMHPYTVGLMKSIPRLDNPNVDGRALHAIKGTVPNLLDLPPGCKFNNRCDLAHQRCLLEEPPLIEVDDDHVCRCWLNG